MERRLAAVELRQEQDVMELEEQYHDRMADLEERLDFTERVMAQRPIKAIKSPDEKDVVTPA